MGQVICMMSISLDGFVEGPGHDISWHQVDDEVHTHFNEVAKTMASSVEGRRTYELMAQFWPTADSDPDNPPAMIEYAAIWRETPKVVVSRTLQEAGWNTTIWRDVDPQRVAELTRAGDVGLGGADLAATFARLDLIDSYRIYVHPVLIGSGTPLFRPGGPQHALRLVGTRTFGNGVVGMRHERVRE